MRATVSPNALRALLSCRGCVAASCTALVLLVMYALVPPWGPSTPVRAVWAEAPAHMDAPRNCSYEPGYRNTLNGIADTLRIKADDVMATMVHRRFRNLVPRHPKHKHVDEYTDGAGFQVYNLLCYLSQRMKRGSLVVDVGGEGRGMAGMAMGCSPYVPVFSFDLVDTHDLLSRHHWKSSHSFKQALPTVFFVRGSVLDPHSARILLAASVVHVDAEHRPDTVPFERSLFAFLRANCFGGLVVLSDINANDEMRRWWDSIDLKKHDATVLGTRSGTGIVDFSGFLDLVL